jgi:hypothetical protein
VRWSWQEHIKITCVLTNKYVRVMPCPAAPLEVLMTEIDDRDKPDPGKAAVASRPARDSVRGSRDGRDGAGGIAVRDFPAGPEPGISRPGTAPAYYLGRPARLWITVMRPRRRRTTSGPPHPATRPARDRCEMTWPVSFTGPWSPPTSRHGPAGSTETQDWPASELSGSASAEWASSRRTPGW